MNHTLDIPAVAVQRRTSAGVTRTVQTVTCSCCGAEIDVPVGGRPRPAVALNKILGHKGWDFDARRGRHSCGCQ